MSRVADPQRAGGFTLLELTIVMGILTGFLVMLVQLVNSGLSMFGEGELGQALADRSSQAQRVITRELAALRGSDTGRDRDVVDDRLVVQSLPIGLPNQPERDATRVQVLRAAVHLPPDRELALVEGELTARLGAENPNLTGEALRTAVLAQRDKEPLRGIGSMLLLPWRQEGEDDALLELRAAWFLPGQQLPVSKERSVDPFLVPLPGSPDLPGVLVWQTTIPVLRDLLHVEFLFWGQATTSWGAESATGASATRTGPQRIWDSSRGGWLSDEASGGVFVYDRGPTSFDDPSDDIHPHAVLVRCVVAQPADFAPEGLLAGEINNTDNSLMLLDGTRFPGADDGGFVKIGGEWLHYGQRDGDQLVGLQRGARRTKPIPHAAGARVHVGRQVEFVVPVLHAKDDWNG